mgnify:CR=1 FL=1
MEDEGRRDLMRCYAKIPLVECRKHDNRKRQFSVWDFTSRDVCLNHIKKLFNKENSDVIVDVNNGHATYHAHSIFLAQSSFFKSYLESKAAAPSATKNEKPILIISVAPEFLEYMNSFFGWFYFQDFTINNTNVLQLLFLSDEYGVDSLANSCVAFIKFFFAYSSYISYSIALSTWNLFQKQDVGLHSYAIKRICVIWLFTSGRTAQEIEELPADLVKSGCSLSFSSLEAKVSQRDLLRILLTWISCNCTEPADLEVMLSAALSNWGDSVSHLCEGETGEIQMGLNFPKCPLSCVPCVTFVRNLFSLCFQGVEKRCCKTSLVREFLEKFMEKKTQKTWISVVDCVIDFPEEYFLCSGGRKSYIKNSQHVCKKTNFHKLF